MTQLSSLVRNAVVEDADVRWLRDSYTRFPSQNVSIKFMSLFEWHTRSALPTLATLSSVEWVETNGVAYCVAVARVGSSGTSFPVAVVSCAEGVCPGPILNC